MLKLYHNPRSTFSRRVRIALAEKNIHYEEVVVDMAKRGHKSPEYLALNPYGRVPVIDDDGFILYESTAILNYLETTRPAPPLVPPDIKQRALVDMHMKLCDIQMGRYTGIIIFPKRFLPKERWDSVAMAAAKQEIENHIAVLEQQLSGKQYLVADQFSLADICYMPLMHFAPLMDIDLPPAVASWAGSLLARPSANETKPDR